MLKIYFFLLGDSYPTTTYSDFLYAEYFRRKGHEVNIIYDLNEKLEILNCCKADIIFFQKTIQCLAHTEKYISSLKGKIFLCHIDDDFYCMNKNHIETLNASDLVFVATNEHKEELKKYISTPVEKIDCIMDVENYKYLPSIKRKNEQLIISWQQSNANAYINDLLSILSPLIRVYNEKKYILNIYGVHKTSGYIHLCDCIKRYIPFAKLIEYKPYNEYIKQIIPQIAKSDIYICPYLNIPERLGKSGYGLKRIMLLGIPVIASNTAQNKSIINDGVNGYTANNDEEWFDKLNKLINDESLREKFSITARKDIESRFSEEKVMSVFINKLSRYFPEINNY